MPKRPATHAKRSGQQLNDVRSCANANDCSRTNSHSCGCEHILAWTLSKGSKLIPAIGALAQNCLDISVNTQTIVSRDEDMEQNANDGSGVACADCNLEAEAPTTLAENHRRRQSVRGHHICIDRRKKELYCLCCEDYVYLEEFDAALFALGNHGGVTDRIPADAIPTQPELGHKEQSGSKEDKTSSLSVGEGNDSALEHGPVEFDILKKIDSWPPGLRGMNNMGNTCFMNSVLQALIHTPLLSNYYLRCMHCEGKCRVSAEGGHCVECQLDAVISDMYNGDRSAYSPVKFLYTWWMMAGGLMSGYKQQDAHEFFLFILQMLTGHPDSVATSLFIGQVQSHVCCHSCGRTSIQKDEFSHLSLDVTPPASLLPPAIIAKAKCKTTSTSRKKRGRTPNKKGPPTKAPAAADSSQRSISVSKSVTVGALSETASMQTADYVGYSEVQDTLSSPSRKRIQDPELPASNNANKSSWNHSLLSGYLRWPGDSLLGCLRRYTHPEVLDRTTHHWSCPDCDGKGNATKQMSITQLPPILTMHFKRFEHTGGPLARARKLETFVSFPLDDLDMTPYLFSRVVLEQLGVRRFERPEQVGQFRYDAFAIICHRGTFQGGHYVAYVRCKDNKWYLADDAYITEVPVDVVQNSQAYMVLYSLQQLAPWRQ
jgi:ubiquitin C-terminal hydrolase